MRKWLTLCGIAVAVLVLGGAEASEVDLSGTWQRTVNGRTVTLTITQSGEQVTIVRSVERRRIEMVVNADGGGQLRLREDATPVGVTGRWRGDTLVVDKPAQRSPARPGARLAFTLTGADSLAMEVQGRTGQTASKKVTVVFNRVGPQG